MTVGHRPGLYFNPVSTHMPLARHDKRYGFSAIPIKFLLTCLLRGMTSAVHYVVGKYNVSTHMPLARHDGNITRESGISGSFYSHASCEA